MCLLIDISVMCPICGEIATKKVSPTNPYFSPKIVCSKCQNSYDFLSNVVSGGSSEQNNQAQTSSGIILIQQ